MDRQAELIEARAARFLAEHLEPLLHPHTAPLEVEAWTVPGEPVPVDEGPGGPYGPFRVGDTWGPPWGTTWFRFRGRVPVEWAGQPVVALVRFAPTSGEGFGVEGLIHRDGTILGAINTHRPEVPVARRARGGEAVEFHVEAAANPPAPMRRGQLRQPEPDPIGAHLYRLEEARLAVQDPVAWDLVQDVGFAVALMQALPREGQRRGRLRYVLNQLCNELRPDDPSSWAPPWKRLREQLEQPATASAHRISAVGHAHIDTAWLWPVRETIRKCARTFATALQYFRDYPEYVFSCSQAVQYSWMRQHHPEILAGIQEATERGQWEPVGSAWVEMDCNIPSGESLVRQLLLGKLFFQEELGVETRELWLPDVFGYPASLPQLLRLAGVDHFLTQKISWNQVNRFPYHTFWWEGLDGTRILTHFPPADTYTGSAEPDQLLASADRFREKDRLTCSLYPYGFGDGGGGPTRRQLELLRRARDCEGLPRVASEKVSDFFQRAASEAQDLPVWCGELYLELHRGTLTTQAACKRGNRRGELLLRDAEILDAVEHVLCGEEAGPSVLEEAPPRAVYDTFQHPEPERRRGHAGALDRAWKLLLLDQFHDILPGSSIAWVYRDCARDHEVVQVLGDLVRSDSLGRIAARVECGGAARPVLLCNTLGAARRGVWEDPDGRCRWVQVPACGYAVVDLDREPELPGEVRPVTVTEEDGVLVVANGLLRLAVDVDGTISSIRDLPAHREVLAPGRSGNLLQLHQDEPLNWDAWDIDPFYREVVEELRELEQLEVVEATPMRCRVRMVRRFRDSSLRQELVLRAGSARVDFPTEVEWRERNRLLKVAFPVQVLAREAAFEIQYGHVRRPTHTNTSWDQARFEVCGHRWADLSESGYGVALLNDCKYGYDVQGNVLRLSLLRGPTAPDPDADLGHHRFTYALLPHRGDLAAGGVIPAAGDLNSPLVARPAGGGEATLPPAQSWFSTDRPELVIDCVKVAEREEAIIVRLYEAHGSRGEGRLRVHLPLTHHGPVDLLEQGAADRPLRDGEIPITYSPFSVHTIKLTPRARDVPRPESRGS